MIKKLNFKLNLVMYKQESMETDLDYNVVDTVDNIKSKMDEMSTRIGKVEESLEKIANDVSAIDNKIDALGEKVDFHIKELIQNLYTMISKLESS